MIRESEVELRPLRMEDLRNVECGPVYPARMSADEDRRQDKYDCHLDVVQIVG